MFEATKNIDFVRSHTLDSIENTQILESNIHGFGLVATKLISKGHCLCELDGQVIDKSKYDETEAMLTPLIPQYMKFFFMECNYLEDDKLLVRNIRTKYSYINHSRTPNTEIKLNPMRLVAIQDISKGTELTIDYRNEPLSEAYLARPDKQFL